MNHIYIPVTTESERDELIDRIRKINPGFDINKPVREFDGRCSVIIHRQYVNVFHTITEEENVLWGIPYRRLTDKDLAEVVSAERGD